MCVILWWSLVKIGVFEFTLHENNFIKITTRPRTTHDDESVIIYNITKLIGPLDIAVGLLKNNLLAIKSQTGRRASVDDDRHYMFAVLFGGEIKKIYRKLQISYCVCTHERTQEKTHT